MRVPTSAKFVTASGLLVEAAAPQANGDESSAKRIILNSRWRNFIVISIMHAGARSSVVRAGGS